MSNFHDFEKQAETLLASIKMVFENSPVSFSSNVGYAVLISLVPAGAFYYGLIKYQRAQATRDAIENQNGTMNQLSHEQVN